MVYEWMKKLYSVQLYSFHKCLGSWQPKYMKGVFSKQSLSWMSCSLKIFHLLKWPAIALSVQIQYSILRAHKLIYNSREFWIPSNDYILRLILTTENQNVFHCLIIISSNFLMMFALSLCEANVMRDVMQIFIITVFIQKHWGPSL